MALQVLSLMTYSSSLSGYDKAKGTAIPERSHVASVAATYSGPGWHMMAILGWWRAACFEGKSGCDVGGCRGKTLSMVVAICNADRRISLYLHK